MSKLFSEIYGCYYDIVSHILNKAKNGISKKDIDDIVNAYGFSETAFHLIPQLIGEQWNFLEKRGDFYYSKFTENFNLPLTQLERSWLAALLNEPRIRLFLSEEKLEKLRIDLDGVTPLFDNKDFVSVDKHLDGDPYEDNNYIINFQKIMKACKDNYPITISYVNTGESQRVYYPFKLSYSELNDKFRLLCATFNSKAQKLNKVTLNLAKVTSVEPSDSSYKVSSAELCKLFTEPNDNPPITLEITKERNSLERFLLQFASFDRKTEYDSERNVYTCQISYDTADETELLIRILSFGPTVKVLGPQNFLTQIKERLTQQMTLMDNLKN